MHSSYSINLHDIDGDAHSHGIFIHASDSMIIRFSDLKELTDFIDGLKNVVMEITGNES